MAEQPSRKAYRTEIPNIVEEWGLDVYSYRLYDHYKRWCGEHGTYNRTLRATAKLCKMSPAQTCRARQKLLDEELIQMEPDGSVSVVDIWDLNRAWFVSRRNKSVSDRNKTAPNSNGSVSDRNKLFLPETSLYRKNLSERTNKGTPEDTPTSTEGEGGGGGGSHVRFNSQKSGQEQPLSVYTLEQVNKWAETVPGIVATDRFARARWLDGLADRRIATFYARREAEAVAPSRQLPEVERLPPDLEAEVVQMLKHFLADGRTPESLNEQFAAGIPDDQWAAMRTAAVTEFQRRRSSAAGECLPIAERGAPAHAEER